MFVTSNYQNSQLFSFFHPLEPNTDKEYNVIQNSIDFSKVLIRPLRDATYQTLQTELQTKEYQIVHFSGHGGKEGIKLKGKNGKPKNISTEELVQLFSMKEAKGIRSVVLATCNSNIQAKELSNVVRNIIATNVRITDGQIIAFATTFYTLLPLVNNSVKEAFKKAILASKCISKSGNYFDFYD